MKLIYIKWADAQANSEWFTKEQAEKWADESNWWVEEVGWLIKETPKYICIAGSVERNSPDYDPQFKRLSKIPKTWIKKRKILKP